MRKTLFFLCVSCLFCGGCLTMQSEGGFVYHARGRLVDAASGRPMAGARVYLSFTGLDSANSSWLLDRSAEADNDGNFDARQKTGPAWDQVHLLSIIPLKRFGQAPSPPMLEEVFLLIQIGDEWRSIPVKLTPSRQERTDQAERWLDLGTIRVSPEKLSPITGSLVRKHGAFG